MSNHPVSLSKPIITDWLRNELGFEGVVMTDDIEVGAAVAGMSIEDYAVRTINAAATWLSFVSTPSTSRQFTMH